MNLTHRVGARGWRLRLAVGLTLNVWDWAAKARGIPHIRVHLARVAARRAALPSECAVIDFHIGNSTHSAAGAAWFASGWFAQRGEWFAQRGSPQRG